MRHDDLMMIYSEGDDKPPEAVFADSEGHVIPATASHTARRTATRWRGSLGSAARQAGCVCALFELDGTAKKLGR
jgi:hypothetical protein